MSVRARGLGLLVAAAIALGAGSAVARPDDASAGGLYRFAAGDVVEYLDSARFRVWFTRAGKNAVPSADADGDSVPDHVAEVAKLYEDVLTFYLSRGFVAPLADGAVSDNGGDGRFDVYLLDFGGSADGHFVKQSCTQSRCIGYMVQENDFVGYAYPTATIGNRVLSSHELFHAVQAAYNADQDSVITEGTAVWATEQFDPTLDDLEGFVGGYLGQDDRTLNLPGGGPVDSFSYGAAIFFQFLGEKLDDDVVRRLYEDCVPGARGVASPDWFSVLGPLLEREYATTFADAFTTFATWNLFTASRGDPARAYAHGKSYIGLKFEKPALPYEDTTFRVFRSASKVVSVDPAGRGVLEVALVPLAGLSTDAFATVTVIVAPIVGGVVGTISTRPATQASEPISVSGATQVFVALVNTAQSGESTRGTLCIGDTAEVTACKAANGGAPKVEPEEDGGCAFAGHRTSPTGAAGVLAFLLFGALIGRRRPREALQSATP